MHRRAQTRAEFAFGEEKRISLAEGEREIRRRTFFAFAFAFAEGVLFSFAEGVLFSFAEGVLFSFAEGVLFSFAEGVLFSFAEGVLFAEGERLLARLRRERSAERLGAILVSSLDDFLSLVKDITQGTLRVALSSLVSSLDDLLSATLSLKAQVRIFFFLDLL